MSSTRSLTAKVALAVFLATAVQAKNCPIAKAQPSFLSSNKFDYLIVGGGTAGLALAARLTENKNVQVAVLEAGEYHYDDPLLDQPSNIGAAGGNPSYDWNFVSVPQAGANGRSLVPTRGKLLGGSSGMNFLAWNRASKPEYDAWDTFAPSSGWTWSGLLPYFNKTNTAFSSQSGAFPPIGNNVAPAPVSFHPQPQATGGPIQVSFNKLYADPVPYFAQALDNLGVSVNPSPDTGNTAGLMNSRSNIDRTAGIRSYAPTYVCQSGSVNSNLHILTGAYATKILTTKNPLTKKVVATGVQYLVGSELHSVNATKEVIVSTGAYKSPQLLELSGIGSKTLLQSLGIPVVLDIAAVGENLQDHLVASAQFQVKQGVFTLDELRWNTTLAQEQQQIYNSSREGWLAASNSALAFVPLSLTSTASAIQSLLAKYDSSVASILAKSPIAGLLKPQYDFQRKWLSDKTIPQIELILFSNAFIPPEPQTNNIAVPGIGLHMVNRGSVHINTTDPLAPPVIDPKWLDNDFDVAYLLEGLKYAQKVGQTAPLSDIVEKMTFPPSNVVSDADLINYIKNGLGSAQHPMGTVPIGTPSQGGVVSGQLIVHGTENLRVCDASVIPLSIGTHLQESVYAIAEKLADTIKSGH